jgi:cytochrome b6-f complex iron-sulfur subunit
VEIKRTRRSFLDLLLGATAGAWIGTVLYPIVRYLKPIQEASPTGPSRLDADAVGKLVKTSFVIVPFGGKRVLVFRDTQSKLRALDAKCTHEGCTVQYVPGESSIWCACHNARFDIEGNVVSGPPPRPLPRYAVHEDSEGNILLGQEST